MEKKDKWTSLFHSDGLRTCNLVSSFEEDGKKMFFSDDSVVMGSCGPYAGGDLLGRVIKGSS